MTVFRLEIDLQSEYEKKNFFFPLDVVLHQSVLSIGVL